MLTTQRTKVTAYVVAVAALALAALAVGAGEVVGPPSASGLIVFLLVALFLEFGRTNLQHGAQGSFVFVVHLAALLTFGPFWGGLLVIASALPMELAQR